MCCTLGNRPPELFEVPVLSDLHELVSGQHPDGDSEDIAQLTHLASLPGGERLTHHRALDVEVKLGQIEVRREGLAYRAVRIAFEHECVRLVQPRDPMSVVQARELTLDRMCKLEHY